MTPHEEQLELYNEALDQIIMEYLRSHCILEEDAGFVEKLNEAFYDGKIDSSRYYRIGDSLFVHRRTQLPKCIMEYSPLFYAVLPTRKEDLLSSMRHALQDDFFKDNFSHVSMAGVLDTLLQNTTFDWEAISLPYIEFVAHDTLDQTHRFGKTGVGVMAL